MRPGTLVGAFEIVRLIGGGSAAEVFEARRVGPITPRVALKILRPGMGSIDLLARFEDERELLSQLDHPGIATIIDAGATADGRPWFAMPFVDGAPITRYCDAHGLSIDGRLELIRSICDAMAYTHRRGIVHRDLTPANMLVADVDGTPRPVIVDFGIAKALSRPRRVDSELHVHRKILGTPAYMAPEQTLPGSPIGPPADVFSIGAVMCELLAGAPPLDPAAIDALPIGALYERVRTEPRPLLHSVFARLEPAARTAVAAARSTTADALSLSLRDELSWIVRRALDLDPDRRYATSEVLAGELDRLRRTEPLTVGPESRLYRARMFARRHRGPVIAASVVTFALLTAMGVSVAFAASESRARQRADTSAKETQQVVAFQSRMLRDIDPAAMGGQLRDDLLRRYSASLAASGLEAADIRRYEDDFTRPLQAINTTDTALALLREAVLDSALHSIEAEFEDQPVVQAQLRQSIADALAAVGYPEEAVELQTQALETQRQLLEPGDPRMIDALAAMGRLLRVARRSPESEPYLREALAQVARAPNFDASRAVELRLDLSKALLDRKEADESAELAASALALAREHLGHAHRLTLNCLHRLGQVATRLNDHAEAERLYREVLAVSESVSGSSSEDSLLYMMELGFARENQGHPAEAAGLYQRALDGRRALFGEHHPLTLSSLMSLGTAMAAQGLLDDAEVIYLKGCDLALMAGARLSEYSRVALTTLIKHYRHMDDCRPSQGYDAKAAAWQATLDAWEDRPRHAPTAPKP